MEIITWWTGKPNEHRTYCFWLTDSCINSTDCEAQDVCDTW